MIQDKKNFNLNFILTYKKYNIIRNMVTSKGITKCSITPKLLKLSSRTCWPAGSVLLISSCPSKTFSGHALPYMSRKLWQSLIKLASEPLIINEWFYCQYKVRISAQKDPAYKFVLWKHWHGIFNIEFKVHSMQSN